MLDYKELETQLNLDSDAETDNLIQSLLNQSEDICWHSIDSTIPLETWESNDIFVRACYTLATQFFYDRSLENGLSKGMLMMLAHLKGQVKVTTTTTKGDNDG
ncbi:head-tail connector protein [Ligilactobacillus acidipiscis]|uniref:head-tail connector protein n=1 Tax=Ligilactobacillus acidipiscis TaxID=89059 RepID=UPI0023F9C8B7|nr:head-tail connector protein [Ligilactobacillus acidipiscis]WEV57858.1 head-tail connector protein [Ligilactobacillus acidipiscis]